MSRRVDKVAVALIAKLKRHRAEAVADVLDAFGDDDDLVDEDTIAKAKDAANDADPDAYADDIHDRSIDLAKIAWDEAAKRFGVEVEFDAAPAWAKRAVRSAADDIGKTIAGNDRRTMLGVLERAIPERMTARDVATAIKTALAPMTSYDDAGKVVRTLDATAYLNMVAVTELHRASNVGEVALYEKAGIAKVQWQVGGDPCDNCADAEGTIVTLGMTFPSVGVDMPPAHPNCRCSIVPVTEA